MGLARVIIRRLLVPRALPRTRIGRQSWLDEVEDLLDIYQISPKFDENYWESTYTDVIESMVQFAGNPGQQTLLTDYFPDPAKAYCSTAEKDYDPVAFVNYVQARLGDTYYYAINEIIDECSLILQEVWDQSKQTLMEGLFGQSFGTDFSTVNRIYGSNRDALASYQAAAARNGDRTGNSPEDNKFNAEKRRQSLIKRFGSGPTKPLSSRSGMENIPAYAAYQQAAARNGKIIKP
jgi:hypothetical protein